ncbi:MAG: DUF3316 domain-containing protein [Muribaculaceae bacterium]|nr:DUF3316 domain-containing protein [Muribaculaceae bacterium]
MKNSLQKFLLIALLLALPITTFAKSKEKEDSTYCPLHTALEFNIGGGAWKDKYMSYYTYSGTSFSVGAEMMRAGKNESKWVQQHQLRYMYNSGTISLSDKGKSKSHLFNYTFGYMYNQTVAPKLRLYYGFDINALGGYFDNAHKGNNPISIKGDLSLGFTGMAVYDFHLGKRPITARYQMSLPVFATFIQVEQGYSNIIGAWHLTTWDGHFNMRNRLLFDLHFDSWALRLGYNNDIMTYYATSNHFQYVSHNLVVGFAGDLMRWSEKNMNKKIKSAIYTY